ncbi:MAG TPA: hypothetical protein VLF67_01480 [Candidatus Saccharimonas sp.]|nr:hypothetical protein [Candidatus Saccharimonas sp.]
MNQSYTPLRIAGIVAVVGLLVIVLAAYAAFSHADTQSQLAVTDQPTATPTPGDAAPAPSTTPTSGASAYRDGTYAATGQYISPGGAQSIRITLTVQHDVVTATSAVSGAIDGESRQYQTMFISGYRAQVVGKPLSTLSLNRVSGSSLTSGGFNDAVAQIKAQAQS